LNVEQSIRTSYIKSAGAAIGTDQDERLVIDYNLVRELDGVVA
jgi:hypothetical protein